MSVKIKTPELSSIIIQTPPRSSVHLTTNASSTETTCAKTARFHLELSIQPPPPAPKDSNTAPSSGYCGQCFSWLRDCWPCSGTPDTPTVANESRGFHKNEAHRMEAQSPTPLSPFVLENPLAPEVKDPSESLSNEEYAARLELYGEALISKKAKLSESLSNEEYAARLEVYGTVLRPLYAQRPRRDFTYLLFPEDTFGCRVGLEATLRRTTDVVEYEMPRDGNEALEMVIHSQNKPFDGVVTDLNMPSMGGAEFAQRVRTQLGLTRKHLPIYFRSTEPRLAALTLALFNSETSLCKDDTPAGKIRLEHELRGLIDSGAFSPPSLES